MTQTEARTIVKRYLRSLGVKISQGPSNGSLVQQAEPLLNIRGQNGRNIKTRVRNCALAITGQPINKVPVPDQSKPASFYGIEAWRRLRYRALIASDGCCECCGTSPSKGKPLHVDHIKPRSKYPDLELEISNLQVLCDDCNLGKGAWDETDWRGPRLVVAGENP